MMGLAVWVETSRIGKSRRCLLLPIVRTHRSPLALICLPWFACLVVCLNKGHALCGWVGVVAYEHRSSAAAPQAHAGECLQDRFGQPFTRLIRAGWGQQSAARRHASSERGGRQAARRPASSEAGKQRGRQAARPASKQRGGMQASEAGMQAARPACKQRGRHALAVLAVAVAYNMAAGSFEPGGRAHTAAHSLQSAA